MTSPFEMNSEIIINNLDDKMKNAENRLMKTENKLLKTMKRELTKLNIKLKYKISLGDSRIATLTMDRDTTMNSFESLKINYVQMEEKYLDELEEAKKSKSTKTKRVMSKTVILNGEETEDNKFSYEMNDTLASYLTRERMKDADSVRDAKKDLYNGDKPPTLKEVYTYIYDGFFNGDDLITEDPTMTLTLEPTKKAEVKNPKDLSKLTRRCDCIVWSRKNQEDNRCKTEGVETYNGRSICKTHYKVLLKDTKFWNDNGGDYDTQVGRFKDGYYESTTVVEDSHRHWNARSTHNDTDTY